MTGTTDPSYYLEEAPVPTALLHMALPMMASMVLDLAYNLIDAFFIGRLGDTAQLAAVTLAFPYLIVLMGVGQFFGVGGGTLIPRLLGEGRRDEARRASATAFYLALAAGVLAGAASLLGLGPILAVLGASGPALAPTRTFLTILALGSPLIVATIYLAEALRGEGASTASMRGMLLSVAVNVALDPLLIFGLHLGVAGAALATVAGNAAAVAYFVWHLLRRPTALGLSPRDVGLRSTLLRPLASVGSSAFLLAVLMILSSLAFNQAAMAHGEAVVAAFGVANRLVQIVEFLGVGLFAGGVPLLAHAYASGRGDRLGAIVRTAGLAFLGLTLVLGLGLYLFQGRILGLFSQDAAVLEASRRIIEAMLVAALLGGLGGMVTDLFQAFGAGLESNLMALVRGIGMPPLIIVGGKLFGLTGIIWALPASEALACLLGGILWLASGRRLLGALGRPALAA